jgi:hypothetical protein
MSSQGFPSTRGPVQRAKACRAAVVALLESSPTRAWSLDDVWTKLQIRFNRGELERALWRLRDSEEIDCTRKGSGPLYRAKARELDGWPMATKEVLDA